MSQDEDLARLRAEMDQAREGMKEVAASCWAFYRALLEEGFDAIQALRITIAWLTSMTGQRPEANDD